MAAPIVAGRTSGAYPDGGDVLATTRWLALFIIPFLVAAAAILWFRPEDTGRLFAWPIKPRMTALLLATAYAGGIYFFARVALARQWRRVKIGFLPVVAFSSMLGVATLLHWDRFTHGHIAFWTWATLYFVAPFLVLGAWLSNRIRAADARSSGDPTIPLPVRLALGVAGILVGALGVLLFVAPEAFIPAWPWKLSPLTARVVSAILGMQGVAFVGIALDRRWSVASVMFEAELLTVPLIVLAAVRAHADFSSAATLYGVVGGLCALWLAMLGLFVSMRARRAA
jgi:hypothetical protein